MGKEYYQVLGLTRDADQKEIKQSFYKLSKLYHPDLNKDDESALKKFKQVAEAYEILSNPEKRSEYDLKMGFSKRYEIRYFYLNSSLSFPVR